MVNIYKEIESLVEYALDVDFIKEEDRIYTRNLLLDALDLDDYEGVTVEEKFSTPVPILENILNWCHENGRLEHNTVNFRDLLDTKLMGLLMPRPSEVIGKFEEEYKVSPKLATDNYYKLSINSNYIRKDRTDKNIVWKAETGYGALDITINLSKPEKDPKDIIAERNAKQTSYPKCLLCKENEGYRGRVNHPARQNHRIIPLELQNEEWFLQYSPYVYYNEHCIVFKGQHLPMKISAATFERLLGFVKKFPHYFVGSNADLPIVGGSILSHDHFQGGNYEFAMAKAKNIKSFNSSRYEGVEISMVKWPMSVIRLSGKDADQLVKLASEVLDKWRGYSDASLEILAFTGEVPHNTITPIARKRGENFELDLVLRNNRTSEEHSMGIFHPHAEVHHIKKENIGLIEVMGLAVLPARLKEELNSLSQVLTKKLDIAEAKELEKHSEWITYIENKYSNINEANVMDILQAEVGEKFMTVLEHAGVYKDDAEGLAGFERFIKEIV